MILKLLARPRSSIIARALSIATPEKIEHLNIGTIGHYNHGKTTLVTAIHQYLRKLPPQQAKDDPLRAVNVSEYQTKKRKYTQIDCPGRQEFAKALITASANMDAAILVVSALEGIMSQTREHVKICKQFGVPYIIVFLNMADLANEEMVFELTELELKHFLNSVGYDRKSMCMIRGSATEALKDNSGKYGKEAIKKLLETMDAELNSRTLGLNEPFLMTVEEALHFQGEGIVVKGKVDSGNISKNEYVSLEGTSQDLLKAKVSKIQKNEEEVKGVVANNTATMVLEGLEKTDCTRGTRLTGVKSTKITRYFETTLKMFELDEGGRKSPIKTNFKSQYYFKNIDVGGMIILPENAKVALPGDLLKCKVKLDVPIPLSEGSKFVTREGGKTLGCGIVSKIITGVAETIGESITAAKRRTRTDAL